MSPPFRDTLRVAFHGEILVLQQGVGRTARPPFRAGQRIRQPAAMVPNGSLSRQRPGRWRFWRVAPCPVRPGDCGIDALSASCQNKSNESGFTIGRIAAVAMCLAAFDLDCWFCLGSRTGFPCAVVCGSTVSGRGNIGFVCRTWGRTPGAAHQSAFSPYCYGCVAYGECRDHVART